MRCEVCTRKDCPGPDRTGQCRGQRRLLDSLNGARDAERLTAEATLAALATQEVVAAVFHVSVSAMRGSGRTAAVALARQTSAYLCHTELGLSYQQIARIFDRHRATIAHACGRVEDRRDDERFNRVLMALEEAVRAIRGLGDRFDPGDDGPDGVGPCGVGSGGPHSGGSGSCGAMAA